MYLAAQMSECGCPWRNQNFAIRLADRSLPGMAGEVFMASITKIQRRTRTDRSVVGRPSDLDIKSSLQSTPSPTWRRLDLKLEV